MESTHKTDPITDLGVLDLFIANIQVANERYAMIKDLVAEHKISVCSKCSFASSVKGGVKRHIHQCKNGSGMEVEGWMSPVRLQ
jgi:hypothetical protein